MSATGSPQWVVDDMRAKGRDEGLIAAYIRHEKALDPTAFMTPWEVVAHRARDATAAMRALARALRGQEGP